MKAAERCRRNERVEEKAQPFRTSMDMTQWKMNNFPGVFPSCRVPIIKLPEEKCKQDEVGKYRGEELGEHGEYVGEFQGEYEYGVSECDYEADQEEGTLTAEERRLSMGERKKSAEERRLSTQKRKQSAEEQKLVKFFEEEMAGEYCGEEEGECDYLQVVQKKGSLTEYGCNPDLCTCCQDGVCDGIDEDSKNKGFNPGRKAVSNVFYNRYTINLTFPVLYTLILFTFFCILYTHSYWITTCCWKGSGFDTIELILRGNL